VSELFPTGRVVDLILVLMVVEALALAVYRRRSGRGVPTVDLVVNLLAGGALLLALRAALTAAGWQWIAMWLAVALAAHGADLARRWRP
jgi:hypothetical protein